MDPEQNTTVDPLAGEDEPYESYEIVYEDDTASAGTESLP